MRYPNLNEEKKLWREGYKIVVGLDESGRGPLAGPVVACAVSINPICEIRGKFVQIHKIKDSKKLTPKKREEFYKVLINHPQIKWGIGIVSEKVIDRINILEATRQAMKRAVLNLSRKIDYKPDFLIIDGNSNLPKIKLPQKCIIKADEKVISCTLASIIGKVKRDRIMERYHKKYPQYGFDKHKGYPTKKHRQMLKKYGTCKIHRQSFKPVIENKKLKIKYKKFTAPSSRKCKKYKFIILIRE